MTLGSRITIGGQVLESLDLGKEVGSMANFPLFVKSKDHPAVYKYDSIEDVRRHVEAIDVENDEYQVWDRDGFPVQLDLSPDHRIILKRASSEPEVQNVLDAFAGYARLANIPFSSGGAQNPKLEELYEQLRTMADRKWNSMPLIKRILRRF
jgi:hypothetical protein